MKWNRFSISIIAGLVVGAMVAMYFGNTLPAVLAGVLIAGICTGLLSIDWKRAKESGFEHVEEFVDSCKMLSKNIVVIRKTLSKQKELLFLVTTALLSFVPLSCAVYVIIFSLRANENVSLSTLLSGLIMLFGWHCLDVIRYIFDTDTNISTLRSKALRDMQSDNRNAMGSILHMLKIRTRNAVRFCYFLFTLMPYALLILATSKVRIASVSAMLFSGIHLGLSYWRNWIYSSNPNFWLSLGVTCLLGATIGHIIYKWTPNEVKIPKLDPMPHLPK